MRRSSNTLKHGITPHRPLKLLLLLLLFLAINCAKAVAQENWTQVTPFESYKLNYFLMGQPNTKVQFSMKIPVIHGQTLFFGYTQLMLWEVVRADPYFADINYTPEFFYRLAAKNGAERWLDIGFFEHESNGKGGTSERAWNRSYVRLHNEWDLADRTKLRAELKAWVPYSLHVSNRNLINYRGLWEANIMLSDFKGQYVVEDLIFRIYAGGPSGMDPTQGGQELTFRIKSAKREFLPVLMLQVFHGHAETLGNYRHSYWAYRAGIGF